MEDQLICPICSRDYELPRRYTIRSDDTDFLILPRLLGCLHTCCQSCLLDLWEKNDSTGIKCPQCNHYETLRGVKYLPLDGSAISQMIPLDGASLSFCSRCRDEVPSFSWCEMCSTTLCEFHHQDHKLSALTAKHNVLTFKVISQEKISIEPRMPPISCPEEIEQDATLYCHDCNLLVSSQAMFTQHTNHRCSESLSLTDWAKDLINFSLTSSLQRQESLIKAIKGNRSTLQDLDHNRELAEEDIRSVFQDVRSQLDERERNMLSRLDDIVTRKQEIITSQMEELSSALEKCRQAIFVAESLLNRTENVKGGSQYLVSAAHSISRRGEEIDEEILLTPFEPQTDSFLRGYFVKQEIQALKTIILSLGGILTQDNIPGGPNQEVRKINSVLEQSPRKSFPLRHQLTFTVRTRSPPKLSVDKKQSTSKEAVIVEARLKTPHSEQEGLINGSSSSVNRDARTDLYTPDSLLLVHRLNHETLLSDCPTDTSLDELLGEVVGQVVFLTEVDTNITSRHKVRSNYESFHAEDTGLPTFRVTREIVAY